MRFLNCLRLAIVGTGKVGCDFLVKALNEPSLEVILFAGQRESDGLVFARNKKVPTSIEGISAIVRNIDTIDVIVDATNADANREHFRILKKYSKFIVNLTPSGIGSPFVPGVLYDKGTLVHNFISCGAQACLPILYNLLKIIKIKYFELVIALPSESIGPATRFNVSNCLETTSDVIAKITTVKQVKTILIINPSTPSPPMRICTYFENSPEFWDGSTREIRSIIDQANSQVQKYMRKYENIEVFKISDSVFCIQYEIVGSGDYCSPLAGNLDVINCAAIEWCRTVALWSI